MHFLKERQAIALPPPIKPLPLVAPLVISLSALLYQNIRPITEALLTRHLRTKTTIKQLSITPFHGRIRGVSLSDKNAQPLLTATELSINVTRKKLINFAIAANGITLHADINPVDWRDSNWNTHLSKVASELASLDTGQKETIDVQPGENGESQFPRRWFEVSLTTQKTAVHIMKPSLTLSIPPLVIPSNDLSSISVIRRLVDGVLGRAARDMGARSFPRELRMGARRAARGVAVKAVESVFADAGRKVSEWRKRVDEVREFVKDVPDIDNAHRMMKDVGGVLRGLESLLSREENAESPVPRKEQAGRVPDEVQGFRELDEGKAD